MIHKYEGLYLETTSTLTNEIIINLIKIPKKYYLNFISMFIELFK